MTTEDEFQAQLDANPDDWQTRGVLADFLEENNDPRAEGYRALAHLMRRPVGRGDYKALEGISAKEAMKAFRCPYYCNGFVFAKPWNLPSDWFYLLIGEEIPNRVSYPLWVTCSDMTRRQLDDETALAFSRLPAERKKILMSLKIE